LLAETASVRSLIRHPSKHYWSGGWSMAISFYFNEWVYVVSTPKENTLYTCY